MAHRTPEGITFFEPRTISEVQHREHFGWDAVEEGEQFDRDLTDAPGMYDEPDYGIDLGPGFSEDFVL